MQLALGDEIQEGGVQRHYVGPLHARMPGDVVLQRVEHVLGGDLAQPREVAAVVCFLQAQEVTPRFLEKTLDVETRRNIGYELAAVVPLHAPAPCNLQGRLTTHRSCPPPPTLRP